MGPEDVVPAIGEGPDHVIHVAIAKAEDHLDGGVKASEGRLPNLDAGIEGAELRDGAGEGANVSRKGREERKDIRLDAKDEGDGSDDKGEEPEEENLDPDAGKSEQEVKDELTGQLRLF